MRNLGTLLTLPSALLTLLLWDAAHGYDALYDPFLAQDELIAKRDQDAISQLATQRPHGVRKMSADPGEKFWPHYWEFRDAHDGNTTALEHPFALHTSSKRRLSGRAIFARDASCPSGTSSCVSIGHSDSCCPSGDTCITVQDTGNGPVGCCAAGGSCGNTIGDCNTSQGYSACPDSSNKGCCIPGYACSGNICVNVGTQTITPVQSTTSSTATSSSPTQVVVSVITVTNLNTSGYTTTATVTQTVTQSASGSTSSDTAVVPVRPTTNSDTTTIAPATVGSSSTSTSTSSSTTSAAPVCPNGYYMCSAVYLGGCCQVDRDCNTTSCPPTATTTVVGGVATVVAPTDATSNAPT
ncbi:hypothetical protein AMS68_002388 [Peltaster fructicola]|uniref:GPI anchored protein n=1 Tax=Peltaster fructicola TaxID=286661 RepID=A0A6H0XQE4_9PEZI|nr:hypothetical protein AMS68_002388 [Peltaster fructicola]